MPLLDWLNKDQAVKQADQVPYRLLEPVPELSYGDPHNENMLIQGDNLDALKALLPLYAGKVKCIYIDPPYNTKSAFEHYDDNLEHSQWLSMMYPRLELLRELLSEDGSIWVSTDFTGQTGHATPSQFYTIVSPNGMQHPPPKGRCWALAESTFCLGQMS